MQKVRNLKANMQKKLTDCCGEKSIMFHKKTEAGEVSSRGFSPNGEGSNSTAGLQKSPLEVDRNATGVNTNGASGLALTEAQLKASLAANAPMATLIGRVVDINASITGTVGAMVDVLQGSNSIDLPSATSKEFGNLCGSLSRAYTAAGESYDIVSRIVGSQIDATSGQIPQAESVPPCSPDPDSGISDAAWETQYGVLNDGPTKVDIVPSEPAETPEPQEVDRKSHSVIDGDSSTVVQSDNPMEVGDGESDDQCLMDMINMGIITDKTNYRGDETVKMIFTGSKPADEGDVAGILPFGEWPFAEKELLEAKVDDNGNKVLDDKGEPVLVPVKKTVLKPLLRRRPISGINGSEVHLSVCWKADGLKPGTYSAWLVKRDGSVSMTAEYPFTVDSVRTLKGMENKTGYSVQTFHKHIAIGTIKPENVVGRCATCNKTRLYESAIDDLVAAGVRPYKKRRARLEKFLARRQSQK